MCLMQPCQPDTGFGPLPGFAPVSMQTERSRLARLSLPTTPYQFKEGKSTKVGTNPTYLTDPSLPRPKRPSASRDSRLDCGCPLHIFEPSGSQLTATFQTDRLVIRLGQDVVMFWKYENCRLIAVSRSPRAPGTCPRNPPGLIGPPTRRTRRQQRHSRHLSSSASSEDSELAQNRTPSSPFDRLTCHGRGKRGKRNDIRVFILNRR